MTVVIQTLRGVLSSLPINMQVTSGTLDSYLVTFPSMLQLILIHLAFPFLDKVFCSCG